MALSGARTTRTPKPNRRQELIEAAVATIAEEGLSGTTLAKVAARSGLTAAAVSFHFSSKETLLLETLGYVAGGDGGSGAWIEPDCGCAACASW